jgi:hypothetical protein
MSDRPTPEADALAVVCYGEGGIDGSLGFRALPLNDACNLERQRDAAISRFESSQHVRMELKRERDEARELARELRDALVSACRFVDCYESESAAAIDDKWATARKCNAALIKAKEVLP